MDDFEKFYKMGLSKEKSKFDLDEKTKKMQWDNPEIPDVEISPDNPIFIITDGGIFYNGRRVILYIRDQAQYFGEDRNFEYKFHLTGCSTLKSMLAQRRYEKYVIKREINNIFKVNLIIDNKTLEKEMELHICKHCLRALNWQGYKNAPAAVKNKIYTNFSIEEFFDAVNNDNQKNFEVLPDYTDLTAPPNIYPENWAVISKIIRTEAGYICENCHRKITDTKNLHVHHRNAIKNDCRRANLEVLCAACHQEKHNHKILGGTLFD